MYLDILYDEVKGKYVSLYQQKIGQIFTDIHRSLSHILYQHT